MTPALHSMTDRELYKLAFDISEILTEREMMRQYGILGAELAAKRDVVLGMVAGESYSVKVA